MSTSLKDLLIVIPAWNEERNIVGVIDELKEAHEGINILVVNDGSTDKTSLVCSQKNIPVLSLPFNLGVGAAMRLGFKYAKENNFRYVIQLDADGQHVPSEIPKILEALKLNNVVVGTRFLRDDTYFKVNFLRRIAMLVLARLLSFITKSKLTDVTSGFRGADKLAIEVFAAKYPPEYLGDTIESLVIAHKHGLTIEEVSVQMRARNFGTSSQSTIKALMYTIRAFAVLALSVLHKVEKPKSGDAK